MSVMLTFCCLCIFCRSLSSVRSICVICRSCVSLFYELFVIHICDKLWYQCCSKWLCMCVCCSHTCRFIQCSVLPFAR